jgi:colanic acid biosynthesis glycosyl transferase WcaI
MRILIVGLNFHPELTGIGKYTGEMACFLSQEGHQVRVVTTPPYYPHWQVQKGYRWWRYRSEAWRGMRVYRSPLWVPRTPSGMKRLLHLLSFAVSSIPPQLRQISWRPDVILCIAPAFFSAPFAWMLARMSGAKAWLHIQDFELDAATNLGILPEKSTLKSFAMRVESWMLSRFDRVSTISKRMMASLEEKGVPKERIRFLPNWVDTSEIYPLPDSRDLVCRMFGVPDKKALVLYAGNMGVKQGLELVLEAAGQLRTFPDIHFVMSGDGAARKDLVRAAEGLENVQFLPVQPIQRLNALLNMADIHILPQRAVTADLVMPSKLMGMLASGKAVVATAYPGTEIGEVIKSVGVLVPPGEVSRLCQAILGLARSPELQLFYGQRGRAYACEHWSVDKILSAFQIKLHDLVYGQPSHGT